MSVKKILNIILVSESVPLSDVPDFLNERAETHDFVFRITEKDFLADVAFFASKDAIDASRQSLRRLPPFFVIPDEKAEAALRVALPQRSFAVFAANNRSDVAWLSFLGMANARRTLRTSRIHMYGDAENDGTADFSDAPTLLRPQISMLPWDSIDTDDQFADFPVSDDLKRNYPDGDDEELSAVAYFLSGARKEDVWLTDPDDFLAHFGFSCDNTVRELRKADCIALPRYSAVSGIVALIMRAAGLRDIRIADILSLTPKRIVLRCDAPLHFDKALGKLTWTFSKWLREAYLLFLDRDARNILSIGGSWEISDEGRLILSPSEALTDTRQQFMHDNTGIFGIGFVGFDVKCFADIMKLHHVN